MIRIDLKPFVGLLTLGGGANLRSGFHRSGSDAQPTESPLDMRTEPRYLFSETPVRITGQVFEMEFAEPLTAYA